MNDQVLVLAELVGNGNDMFEHVVRQRTGGMFREAYAFIQVEIFGQKAGVVCSVDERMACVLTDVTGRVDVELR